MPQPPLSKSSTVQKSLWFFTARAHGALKPEHTAGGWKQATPYWMNPLRQGQTDYAFVGVNMGRGHEDRGDRERIKRGFKE